LQPRSEFPTGAHIGHKNHSVLVIHDHIDLHYVFYYAGDFNSSSSGSQNARTHSWVDAGAVDLKNGRAFGYWRVAIYPDELTVNGTRYDLRKGRVFVLHDDGTLEQLAIPVPLAVAKDPEALAAVLAEHSSSPAEAVLRVTIDGLSASIDAQVNTGEALLVFVGEESLGWASSQPEAAVITATVEASSDIRLDDGSLGKGFIIRTPKGIANVAMTPDGPVPFGELIFRKDNGLPSKGGVFTFADIHQPDGTLVPVSVRVRAKPPEK
jgi:hypothetical protein